jgi:hypothetical protein
VVAGPSGPRLKRRSTPEGVAGRTEHPPGVPSPPSSLSSSFWCRCRSYERKVPRVGHRSSDQDLGVRAWSRLP